MRKKTIVFYTDARSVGGAEIVLAHLAARLDPSRYELRAIVVSELVGDLLSRTRPDLQVTVIPSVATKRDIPGLFAHIRAFRAARADICHVNLSTPFACQYGAVAALASRGTRLVVTEHLPLSTTSRIRRILKRFTARHAAAHVAVGERTAREVEQLASLPAGSIRAVYNGVPEKPLRRRERVTTGPVVGYVGRLDHQKGLSTLLRAVARLPEVTLVLGGDGPIRADLERQSEQLGIRDRVHVTGWDPEARDLLTTFDVLVLPSRYEGFPLVLLEAMLAGVPTVATPVGSVPDLVVDGVTGRLVPTRDVAALTSAIDDLLGDEEQRRRLAEKAQEVVRRYFTVEAMVAAYEGIYDEVAA